MYYRKNRFTQNTYNKFGNKKTEYKGVKYDSRKEANMAFELDMRLDAKDIKHWSRQVRLPLMVNGVRICTYVIDFKIYHNDGKVEYLEIKGFETDVYKLKAKLFKALYVDNNNDVVYNVQ